MAADPTQPDAQIAPPEPVPQPGIVIPRSIATKNPLLYCLITTLVITLLCFFLYAALRRMVYPYEVEWVESGMLVSVLRIAHGQGLYVAPSLAFVPYLYTPLYLYLAAALTKLTGVVGHGYLALRLLSTLSTLGSAAVIYALVRRETQQRIAAIAAAGLYLGCYAVLGTFFDIGRVDALFVFLLLCALLLQRRGNPVLAALVWVLAFQTKQTILPLALLILCAEWPRARRLLAAIGTLCAGTGLSVLALNHATGGWYGLYIFHVARGLPLVLRQALLYLPNLVIGPLAVAWVVVLAAFMLLMRIETANGLQTTLRRWTRSFHAIVSAALILGVWFVEAHRGASTNALMPVYAWAAVLFGVALGRLLEHAAAQHRLRALVLGAAALQLAALLYNPGRFVPPHQAVLDNDRFVQSLRALPGDVYLVNHSYDLVLAGKQPHAEGEALGAVLDAGDADRKLGPASQRLRTELAAAVHEHHYSAMVVDSLETTHTGWGFERDYPLELSTGLAGYRYLTSQPQWFLLPCDAPEATRKLIERPDTITSVEGCGGIH